MLFNFILFFSHVSAMGLALGKDWKAQPKPQTLTLLWNFEYLTFPKSFSFCISQMTV